MAKIYKIMNVLNDRNVKLKYSSKKKKNENIYFL